jgi:ABC-type multidrug transport system ATPase subunit
LKGISLSVAEGDFFALLGPNGAGKSTAIGIVCSLVNKSSGRVAIYGHDIDTDLAAAKRHLGLVPQEFNFNVWEPVEEILINRRRASARGTLPAPARPVGQAPGHGARPLRWHEAAPDDRPRAGP